MKLIFQIILILTVLPCFAQPTGNQKLYLEIIDNGDTLHFENCFGKRELKRKVNLKYNNFQLSDIGNNQTGFEFYPIYSKFIHKTLMTDDHHIQIVKNKTDTMRIEILNAYNVYFLSIPFQKGNFRLYINDGLKDKWLVNTLPFKSLNNNQIVYDISPREWSIFEVNSSKTKYDYFISRQLERQQLLVKPIIPEDDPNFRNPRRVNNLKVEVADFNFDENNDYREQKMNDNTKWNYFIYSEAVKGFVWDTLLSNLDNCYFDFEKKTFLGAKTTRVTATLTQTDNYTYINGVATLFRQTQCVHVFPHSERMDCSIYELLDGKLVFKELIKGCE